jgi:sugar lactone lactonase YvrE
MMMRTPLYGFGLLLVVSATACCRAQPEAAAPPAPAPAPPPPPPPPPAATAAPEAPKEPPGPTPVVRFAEGFATPESVLYDAENDRYLVSNINGKPHDADNNGYIAELSPEGKVTKDKFIAGGTGTTKLNAPKGLALTGGVLYVADIDTVRKFDAKTGAPKGDIPIKGTTFLNDIAVAADGKIYVSDSGLDASFGPNGSEAIWVIEKDKPKPLAKYKELGCPNGLLAADKSVLAVSFNGTELYRIDDKGKKLDTTQLPAGGLDGIVAVGDSLLITSWKSSSIYRGKLGGSFTPGLEKISAPADIGFDTKRNRVLVPRFQDNVVEAYEIK